MTMPSAFDPDTFAAATSEEANDTKFVPIPAGEYTAIIEDVVIRQTDPSSKNPGGSVVADIVWSIDSPALEAELGRRPTVKQGLFLDTITGPNGTQLDFGKGKNVSLGKLRESVGLNKAGHAFNLLKLKGAGPARIKVVQTPSKTSDEIFSNVKSVGKA